MVDLEETSSFPPDKQNRFNGIYSYFKTIILDCPCIHNLGLHDPKTENTRTVGRISL